MAPAYSRILNKAILNRYLQGRVRFPIGGKVREQNAFALA